MAVNNFFITDALSKLTGIFVVFFSVLMCVYSAGFIKQKRLEYYSWFFLTSLASLGVVFSNNLFFILIFWGFLGLAIFKLINLYDNNEASSAAKKTLIIIGGSDGFLLLGFLIYASITSHIFALGHRLPIHDSLSLTAFLFITVACFAKAGCMPFHTWIPDTAKAAPVPVAAFLPASLDKLLGIYLLLRIAKDMFILNGMAQAILLIAGSVTIICAVMMALIQHNIKRLLGYHAVSQVGYMVLGIACGTPLGLAAGLFHMINNALYKSCLFLGAGNIETKAKSTELEELGGLGRWMPVTFVTVFIASLSISGIPPFNGFVSKWMVYQGLINFAQLSASTPMKIIILAALLCALVGSSLTLASFLKINYGVFLGSPKKETKENGEANFAMLVPAVMLSVLCVVFGIFAYSTILPLIKKATGDFVLSGLWNPGLTTNLIVLTGIVGFIIFFIFARKIRTSPTYIGGETLLPGEEAGISDFYNTIRDLKILKTIYALAEKKLFDIYEVCKVCIRGTGAVLRYLHNGVLPTYLAWCLIATAWLFFVFFK
ncbi:MAG: proton-conducting transporter membrane subunit [Candidatus Omnitrophica bacterium]|nr:proton-conducting transporter membrane subunit [Candidatus Omnitrophota bacterium]